MWFSKEPIGGPPRRPPSSALSPLGTTGSPRRVVDQLQVDLLGTVAGPRTQLQDAGVAGVAVVEVGGHVFEELTDYSLVFEDLDHLPTGCQVVLDRKSVV